MSINFSRRQFLASGLGFPALAAAAVDNPFAAKAPQFPATAKNVIFLFMHGGPSHLETFDPKPILNTLHGQHVPPSFGSVQLQFSKFEQSTVLGVKRQFKKYGQSGLEVSDVFPHVAQRADDLAIIRSMYHDGFTHTAALNWLNNGWPRLGRPSIGSWLVYGLGSESENLPAFVAMLDGGIKSGPSVYSSGFLPAMYQGTQFREGPQPILNLTPPRGMKEADQREMLDNLRWFNARHAAAHPDESALEARLNSYELAFRMQTAATDAFDISKEDQKTRDMYGKSDLGAKLLCARRLVERGVRFVQIDAGGWDHHVNLYTSINRTGGAIDTPAAALIADLKQRGLLDQTLVIWGGEFGRTPSTPGRVNQASGRDHWAKAFCCWMAGGGVKGGMAYGETDEIGAQVAADGCHVHDLHATILRLLGFDHTKLTYRYNGRDFRLTDNFGKVVDKIIS